MPVRRVNPYLVKLHRSYSVTQLSERLEVHKNTVREWQRKGLKPLDASRPTLFHGAETRAFLIAQSASRKRPCPPGTIYCFKCREPRPPALGMVEFLHDKPASGDLSALCQTCGTIMHRRASPGAIAAIMPGLAVQIREAPARLIERPFPSLNCDNEKD